MHRPKILIISFSTVYVPLRHSQMCFTGILTQVCLFDFFKPNNVAKLSSVLTLCLSSSFMCTCVSGVLLRNRLSDCARIYRNGFSFAAYCTWTARLKILVYRRLLFVISSAVLSKLLFTCNMLFDDGTNDYCCYWIYDLLMHVWCAYSVCAFQLKVVMAAVVGGGMNSSFTSR